jgi:hypothetical protein
MRMRSGTELKGANVIALAYTQKTNARHLVAIVGSHMKSYEKQGLRSVSTIRDNHILDLLSISYSLENGIQLDLQCLLCNWA